MLSALFFLPLAVALDNGLARTPPMGWMSWSRFFCETDCDSHPFSCINAKLYRDHADRLVEDGYSRLGYEYIHIDDCWMEHDRDDKGDLVPDRKRFSKGITDLVHQRGLKLAIYEDVGTKTCAGYPGSSGFEAQDANVFAQWGVDYLKYDGCNTNVSEMAIRYPRMKDSLLNTGRKIVYSCEWPLNADWDHTNYTAISETCNLWRNCHDVDSNWPSILSIIEYYISKQDTFIRYQSPGAWNDPDMLVIGNNGVSEGAARVQMIVWCLWSAPLIFSNDLRIILPEFAEILKNERLIAVDQDRLGIMARMTTQLYHFVKPMLPLDSEKDRYSYAVGVVNFSTSKAQSEFILSRFGLSDSSGYDVVDLVNGNRMGHFLPSDVFRVTVQPIDAVAFKFTLIDRKLESNAN